jgi:hypothetical protein
MPDGWFLPQAVIANSNRARKIRRVGFMRMLVYEGHRGVLDSGAPRQFSAVAASGAHADCAG